MRRSVGSEANGSLAEGAREALRQVVDGFSRGIPVRAVRRRLIEPSTGMTEPSLEEIWVFGQCSGPECDGSTGTIQVRSVPPHHS